MDTKQFYTQLIYIAILGLIFLSVPTFSNSQEIEKGEIFYSSLSTPPSGYIIERNFGAQTYVVTELAYATMSFDLIKPINKLLNDAYKTFGAAMKKKGANAILDSRNDVKISAVGSSSVWIVAQIWGDAVVLKPISKK